MTGDMATKLMDVVFKDDTSMYEEELKTFNSKFDRKKFSIYLLEMYNDELSNIIDYIPEEYAQDLHTAWEAISRVLSKMKGETK